MLLKSKEQDYCIMMTSKYMNQDMLVQKQSTDRYIECTSTNLVETPRVLAHLLCFQENKSPHNNI